jgi:hypothetical protein
VRQVLDGLEIDDPLVRDDAAAQTARNRATAKRVDRTLRAVFGEEHGRIVVGRWDGGVRDEVLYWLPFLRWTVEHYDVDPSRVLAVSRSGVAAWYADVAKSYQDSPNGDDGAFEASAGDPQSRLSPDLLRELFADYWRGAVPVRRVLLYSRFERLRRPAHPVLENIPQPFVVVDLDSALPFPDTAANRKAARTLVARLASQRAVVPLGTSSAYLADTVRGDGDVLPSLDELQGDDVAARSALIASACAVVGVAGSDSVALGACHGVPTIGLYSDPWTIGPAHAEMMFRTAAALGTTSSLCDVAQLPLLQRVARRP